MRGFADLAINTIPRCLLVKHPQSLQLLLCRIKHVAVQEAQETLELLSYST